MWQAHHIHKQDIVVSCGKAVRINARYQSRKEIEAKLKKLKP
jgi:hypothetical protein